MRPRHTTYPSVYEAYDEQSPVWIEGEAFLSFPKPEHFPSEDPNLAVTWIGFEHPSEIPVFNLSKNEFGQDVLKGAGFEGDPLVNPPGWQTSALNEWKEWNWVRVYYDILRRYYYDFSIEPSNDGMSTNNPSTNTIYSDNCYLVKDRLGNKYYSDYDMHGYYQSDLVDDQKLPGRRWWKPQFNDPGPQYGRQMINHYINTGLDIPNSTVADFYPQDKIGLITSEVQQNKQLLEDPLPELEVLANSLPYDMVQHGPHDDWEDRNNYGAAEVNAGPQSDLTMWTPISENEVRVYTLTSKTPAFFQEMLYKSLGLHWESIYPQEYYTKQDASGHDRGTKFMRQTAPSDTGKPCIYWSDQAHGCKFAWDLNSLPGIKQVEPDNTVPHLKQYKNYYKAHKVLNAPDGTEWDPSLSVNLADQPASKSLSPLTVARENPTNCEEVLPPQCHTLPDLRKMDKKKLSELGGPPIEFLVDEDDAIPGPGMVNRLGYTFEEFLALADGTQLSNTECITGIYANYYLGFKPQTTPGESPWLMLISHPFTKEQAQPVDIRGTKYLIGKAEGLEEILEIMCYSHVESGWISIANWGKSTPMFRALG